MLLCAIIVIQNEIFEAIQVPKFSKDKMTLCKNNEKQWFPDTQTSARPLEGRKNPSLSGSCFNTLLGFQQMLMRRKTCLIPIVVNRFYLLHGVISLPDATSYD